MKFHIAPSAVVCLLSAGLTLAVPTVTCAQHEAGQVKGPSKYLYLSNESVKPGMMSSVTENESAQVQALREANAPVHYIGMVNITGDSRAVFFAGYDSFAEMQTLHEKTASNSKLIDTLRASDAAEGPMLAGSTGSIYEYREDLSLNAPVDLAQIRFFDMTLFHVRSGHHQDFERLVKLYEKIYASIPDAHWAMFEKMYGKGSDNTFLLVTPMKTLAEEDKAELDDKSLPKTAGEDQLQMLRELGSASIESAESDLFALSPRISYVPESWLKAYPDFWGKK